MFMHYFLKKIYLQKKIDRLSAEKERLEEELEQKQIDLGTAVLEEMRTVLEDLLHTGNIDTAKRRISDIGEVIEKHYPYDL